MRTATTHVEEPIDDLPTQPGAPWFAPRDSETPPPLTPLEQSTEALRRALDRLSRTL